MKLKIMVDSSSGITQEEAIKLGIDVFPLRIIFDDKEYLDGIDIMQDEFYEKLTKEEIFPKTSLPNLYEIEKRSKHMFKMDIVLLSYHFQKKYQEHIPL